MSNESVTSPLIMLILILNSLFLGTTISDKPYNKTSIEDNLPTLSFGKYYFESHKYRDIITILSNVKPKDVTVFCLNKSGKYKVELEFYQNIVGYKAEFKGNCEKIKIYQGSELIYYKDFSLE